MHMIDNIFTFVCAYGVLLGPSSMTQSGFQTRKVMAMQGEGKLWEEQQNNGKEFQSLGSCRKQRLWGGSARKHQVSS